MRGDVAAYVVSGADKPGAFQPICSLKHDGKIYLGGRLTDDGSNARAVLFVASATANPVWKLVSTGLEGAKGASGFQGIVGIAAKGGQIVALSSTGEIGVSDDGEVFTAWRFRRLIPKAAGRPGRRRSARSASLRRFASARFLSLPAARVWPRPVASPISQRGVFRRGPMWTSWPGCPGGYLPAVRRLG
jgi:hypothetical protein